MSRYQTSQSGSFGRTIRKFLLSAFVIFTFAAYAFHERFTTPDGAAGGVAPTQVAQAGTEPTLTPPPPSPLSGAAQGNPADTPTPLGLTATSQGAYKDGTYTGPSVDAYYGLVQVQVVIQSGHISTVQFLDYPHDRRTSQEINYQATPWLQQEAIQAQSANVDLISGATLTSEAFVQSLQTALQSAKN
jgi:uncharacterized protein with FMN-binding domain